MISSLLYVDIISLHSLANKDYFFIYIFLFSYNLHPLEIKLHKELGGRMQKKRGEADHFVRLHKL